MEFYRQKINKLCKKDEKANQKDKGDKDKKVKKDKTDVVKKDKRGHDKKDKKHEKKGKKDKHEKKSDVTGTYLAGHLVKTNSILPSYRNIGRGSKNKRKAEGDSKDGQGDDTDDPDYEELDDSKHYEVIE